MRQPEVVHVAGEILLADAFSEPRVETPLLRDARRGEAAIVVRGIEQAFRRQRKDLRMHRVVHRVRITLLEIGPAGAADEQAIAGERERPIVEHERDTSIGMARCRAHFEMARAERDHLTAGQHSIRALRAAGGTQRDAAAGATLEEPGPGDMVRVHVRVDGPGEAKPELFDKGRVTQRLVENRIDEHCGPTVGITQ